MNRAFMVLASEIGSISCFVSAGFLAFYGMEGWGWFLIVGLLTGTTWKFSDKKEEK